MDRPARLYLCVRCRTQVVLCSRCDRGNRYCGRTCSRQARAQAQRQAARRYQGSWRGRMAHALRAQQWRRRRAGAAAVTGNATHCVTHQGSQPAVPTAPLAACTPPSPRTEQPALTAASPPPSTGTPDCWHCRRCGARQGLHLRQGFVRHGLPARRRHDPGP